jgi:tetratricopeptide (TPR) repeat protein
VPALAVRAGEHLAAVGRRALARGDANAAASSLRRAEELLSAGGRRRPDVLLDVGRALVDRGEYEEARASLEAARAQQVSEVAARASVELSALDALTNPQTGVEEIKSVAREAIGVFEQAGDDDGLARALIHLAEAHMTELRSEEMERVLERALSHASATAERARILNALASATVIGPRPVVEGISRCTSILEQAGDHVKVVAFTETMLAVLEAMDGCFDAARERWTRSKRRLEDFGLGFTVSLLGMYPAWIELLAGTPGRAEPELRDAYIQLERVGEHSHLATIAALLARLLCAQGRYDESEPYLEVAQACASEDDIVSQVLWRGTRSRVLARRESGAAADELAASAVVLGDRTDFLMLRADALADRAEVLARLGRQDEADRDLALSRELYARKGIRERSPVADPAQVVDRV